MRLTLPQPRRSRQCFGKWLQECQHVPFGQMRLDSTGAWHALHVLCGEQTGLALQRNSSRALDVHLHLCTSLETMDPQLK